MSYLSVNLKTSRTDIPGFSVNNNYTLNFNVSRGSSVQDLLDNFNAHRRPSKHIKQVVDESNQIANLQIIKKESTFYIR